MSPFDKHWRIYYFMTIIKIKITYLNYHFLLPYIDILDTYQEDILEYHRLLVCNSSYVPQSFALVAP